MDNPKISVIMSVFNDDTFVKESVESILNQSYSNFEFIIIDDCSTDNSLNIISSYTDERIKIIKNQKNIGLTKSLNKSLKIAKGQYIARQDGDDISMNNRFLEQVNYLDENHEIAVLGSNVYWIDKDGEIIREIKNPLHPKFSNRNEVTHGSVMFRKKIIDDLGGYNELLRNAQDYELWLRISNKYKIKNFQKPLYKWRIPKSKKLPDYLVTSQQVIYGILAKMINNGFDEILIENILRTEGVLGVYSLFNFSEKILFYKKILLTYIYHKKPLTGVKAVIFLFKKIS